MRSALTGVDVCADLLVPLQVGIVPPLQQFHLVLQLLRLPLLLLLPVHPHDYVPKVSHLSTEDSICNNHQSAQIRADQITQITVDDNIYLVTPKQGTSLVGA
jgi:hypothetical protein